MSRLVMAVWLVVMLERVEGAAGFVLAPVFRNHISLCLGLATSPPPQIEILTFGLKKIMLNFGSVASKTVVFVR